MSEDWEETLKRIERNKAAKAEKRRLQNERNREIEARINNEGGRKAMAATTTTTTALRPDVSPFVLKRSTTSPLTAPSTSSPDAAEFVPGKGLVYQPKQSQKAQSTNQRTASGESFAQPTMPPEFYKPPPSLRSCMPQTLKSIYIPENFMAYYQMQSMMIHSQVPAGSDVIKEVPKGYNCVLPLDAPSVDAVRTNSYAYPTKMYKVVRETDGAVFALRRVDKLRTTHQITKSVVKGWSRVRHVGIVPLKDIFIKSGALFFLHEYMPGAKSAKEMYLDTVGPLLPESFLWDVAVSLTSAIFAVHSMQMACRCISALRVLITGRGRVWLGSAGVMDVLEFESRKNLAELQREDLANMGVLLLELTCRCAGSARPSQLQNSLSQIAASGFTSQWTNFLLMLMNAQSLHVQQVMQALGSHTFHSLANMAQHAEATDRLLGRQMENGRLLSILLKMGLVNDRPAGQNVGRGWTETGNVYMLKLFRDFVFHQVNDDQTPVVDFGHTIGSLNKLDIGSEEKIVLTSRDAKSMMVVSYADVQRSIQKAFEDLISLSRPSTTTDYGGGRLY